MSTTKDFSAYFVATAFLLLAYFIMLEISLQTPKSLDFAMLYLSIRTMAQYQSKPIRKDLSQIISNSLFITRL